MMVGTWNLAGRWTDRHLETLVAHDCDVWLLTEVSDRVSAPEYHQHATAALMSQRRHWAAVLSRRPSAPLPDPHPASAAAVIDGVTYCSSILPWRSCGSRPPWAGERHADKTAAALEAIDAGLPHTDLVWGGDWNHALVGREYSGSISGRQHILDLLQRRHLRVPTAELPHALPDLLSIDHIAIPDALPGVASYFQADGLSDHAGYVVDI